MKDSLHDYFWTNLQFRWVFSYDTRLGIASSIAREMFKNALNLYYAAEFKITDDVWSMINTRRQVENALKKHKISREVPSNLF